MKSPNLFILDDTQPRYMNPAVRESLGQRVEWAREELQHCRACPRACSVDRTAGELGYCGVGRHARFCSAGAHMGEEDCLRGTRGSGTIFFGGCNLHCVFCQNWDISQKGVGRDMDCEQVARLMLELQSAGCHNINLVTPEHVVPQVIEALALAIEDGLRLPVVYNTSAYDSVASLALLDGLIDIYMPDFKFWHSATAARLCHAADYPEKARAAIAAMHKQVGDLHTTSAGVAVRGLLIRHLVMPGLLDESREIFRWLAELSQDTFVNIMDQYRPENEVGRAGKGDDATGVQFADINRHPTRAELRQAYADAQAVGLWRFDEPRALP
ncbi:MAG: radical SAM protein [Planctomycetota bacterium]